LVEHFHGKDLGVAVRPSSREAEIPVLAALSGTDALFAEPAICN
jgi:hypothetical protein